MKSVYLEMNSTSNSEFGSNESRDTEIHHSQVSDVILNPHCRNTLGPCHDVNAVSDHCNGAPLLSLLPVIDIRQAVHTTSTTAPQHWKLHRLTAFAELHRRRCIHDLKLTDGDEMLMTICSYQIRFLRTL